MRAFIHNTYITIKRYENGTYGETVYYQKAYSSGGLTESTNDYFPTLPSSHYVAFLLKGSYQAMQILLKTRVSESPASSHSQVSIRDSSRGWSGCGSSRGQLKSAEWAVPSPALMGTLTFGLRILPITWNGSIGGWSPGLRNTL